MIISEAERANWDGELSSVPRLESRATEIRVFENTLCPGLLQIRDYAEAVIAAAEWEAESEQIARRVQLRMDRQAALHRAEQQQR